MDANRHGVAQPLDAGLVMRPVRDAHDAERFVMLSASVNGEAEGIICSRLIHHHPTTTYDDYLMIEDERNGEVVSSTCLIPWQLQFEGIVLHAAMLEMVVTHPAYRRRGLVRAQVEHFHQTVNQRHFDLSVIQGIPHYYRQYGYSYALDHNAFTLLPISSIPALPHEAAGNYHFCQVKPEDAPRLAALTTRALSANDLYVQRNETYWRYLLIDAQWNVRILERQDGTAIAYAALRPLPEHEGLEVSESGAIDSAAALAMLQHMKFEAHGNLRNADAKRSAISNLVRSLGGYPEPCDQWLIRIPDIAAFLSKIAPVFESRLADSNCAKFNASVCVNLFLEAFLLRFHNGKLAGVDALGFIDASMGADGGDLCIPRDAFIRLLLGYRDLTELRDAWPDIVVRPGSRHILDVLFPPMSSCVWMPY